MKKGIWLLFLLLIVFSFNGCGNQNKAVESHKDTNQQVWTEEEIKTLFVSKIQGNDWEVVDCVAVSDSAYGRVGAILFWDNEKKTSNVAFMDEEGYYQMCGLDAQIYEEAELTYLGDGAVTFHLQTDGGMKYQCKLSFSSEGGNVSFVAEDDL